MREGPFIPDLSIGETNLVLMFADSTTLSLDQLPRLWEYECGQPFISFRVIGSNHRLKPMEDIPEQTGLKSGSSLLPCVEISPRTCEGYDEPCPDGQLVISRPEARDPLRAELVKLNQ